MPVIPATCRWIVRRIAAPAALLIMNGAGPAAADGAFGQVDLGPDTVTIVTAAERGRLTFGLVRSDYESGREWSLAGTFRVAQPMLFGAPTTFKTGLVTKIDDDDDIGAGVRLTAESYRAGAFGSVFWLAQADSIEAGYYLSVQFGIGRTPFGVAVDTQGNGDWHETSAVLGWRLGETPVSLRLGRKFDAGETFVGLSVNTF